MYRTIRSIFLAVTIATCTWSSFSEACADEGDAEKKPAVVVVRLPADAELTIAGVQSKQSTEVREFDTPPLLPGKKFSYPVKAIWKDGGKEVTRETTVIVRAGETTEINLIELKPSQPKHVAEKIPAPKLLPMVVVNSDPKPKPVAKPEPERKPEPKPEPVKNPEPEKKPEIVKKAEPKPEPVKKPEPKPEPEKKPEPEPVKNPKLEEKPEPVKKPEPKPEPEKKPEPIQTPQPKPQPPAPVGTLTLLLPEVLSLSPGTTKLLPIKIVRSHCEAPVQITFTGLPPGVALKEVTIPSGKQKAYVHASAAASAEEKEGEIKVIGVSGSIRQESSLKIKIAK